MRLHFFITGSVRRSEVYMTCIVNGGIGVTEALAFTLHPDYFYFTTIFARSRSASEKGCKVVQVK